MAGSLLSAKEVQEGSPLRHKLGSRKPFWVVYATLPQDNSRGRERIFKTDYGWSTDFEAATWFNRRLDAIAMALDVGGAVMRSDDP